MEGDPEASSEFYKQFGGSAAANVVFAVAFLVYKVFSQKCKHSKCKGNSKCFSCEAQEDSLSVSKDEEFQRKIEEKMSQMQIRIDQRLRTKRGTAIPISELELRTPSHHKMAEV